MRQQVWYRITEFALLACVSVRTLHYYDRSGLLKPAKRSPAGYRLYRLQDLERLEQIVALKFLGFNLARIRILLNSGTASLTEELDRQYYAVTGKRRLLDAAMAGISDLRLAAEKGDPTAELLKRLVKVITMQNESDWMLEYYTPGAQAKIAERALAFTPEMQAEISQAWKDYYRDLALLQSQGDADGAKTARLESRRRELLAAFTGNDPEIEAGLKALYRDRNRWPDEMRERMAAFESK